MIRTNIPKGSGVELFNGFVVLMSLNEVEVKGDGENVEKGFNLKQDISFRADGLMRSVILSGLMKVQPFEKTLAVQMNRHLRERGGTWMIAG